MTDERRRRDEEGKIRLSRCSLLQFGGGGFGLLRFDASFRQRVEVYEVFW